MMDRRPTLLEQCRWAATAAEARYRVPYANSRPRVSRIIALDDGAATIAAKVSRQGWSGAQFLIHDGDVSGLDWARGEPEFRLLDGPLTSLSDALEGADVAVMLATSSRVGGAASVISKACGERRIMTAGLVIGSQPESGDAVNAMRPFASVLVVSPDPEYVSAMLVALRA